MVVVEKLLFMLPNHAIPADCVDIHLHLRNVEDGYVTNDTEAYLDRAMYTVRNYRPECTWHSSIAFSTQNNLVLSFRRFE